MATLTGGSVTPSDPHDGTATATVTSDSTEGTIYAAVKLDTGSNAYTTGDEDAIKNGTGAVWDSGAGQTPIDGTNTFTINTGIDPTTDYHCGFVQEVPDVGGPIPTFSYDFETAANPANDGWTARSDGQVYCFDNNGDMQLINTDAIPRHGGSFAAGVVSGPAIGITPHSAAINTLTHNGCDPLDYINYWADGAVGNNINLLNPVQHGAAYFLKAEYKTATPSEEHISADRPSASYTGPWGWSCFVIQGNTPGFSVEFSENRGTATFNWEPDGTLTLESTADNPYSVGCMPVGGGVWIVTIVSTNTATHTGKTLHFYPDKKGSTPVVGNYTYIFGGTLVDDKYCPPSSNVVGATPVSMPFNLPQLLDQFSITGGTEMSFYVRKTAISHGGGSTGISACFHGSTNSNRNYCYATNTGTQLLTRIGGATTLMPNAWTHNNLNAKLVHTVDGTDAKAYEDAVETGGFDMTGQTFSGPFERIYIGTNAGGTSGVEAIGCNIHKVEIYEQALTAQEMENLT